MGDTRRTRAVQRNHEATVMTDIPELSAEMMQRAIPSSVRRRLIEGQPQPETYVPALRAFLGLTQEQLALAMRICVHTLRNWEQGRRRLDGPAIALLRIAARHPRVILEQVRTAA
jgi:DNA-binding transcriptional regulator YiaG